MGHTKQNYSLIIISLFITLLQLYYPFVNNTFAEGKALVELTSLRNANTRVWQSTKIESRIDLVTGLPTQSQRTSIRYIYEKADGLNYNASTGKRPDWRPTVEAFQSVQDASYPYQVNQGPYQIKFNTGASASFPITYQVNGKTMQLGLRELAFYNPKTQVLTPLQSFHASTPIVNGNKIRYANAFSGIDVEYVYTKSQFQQNLIVQFSEALPNPAQYGLSSTDVYLVSVTEINMDNFSGQIKNHNGEGFTNNLLSGENGEIIFKDTSSQHKPICQFNLSHAIDNQHQQKSMYKHLMQQNGKYYLVEGIPYTWLQSAQYPIVLDYELKSGASSINEVWKAGNTYYVSGEYTIGNGNTLVIEPGTICKFSTECRITAGSGGKVIAKGKPYDYILFTSWKDAANGETISTTYSTPTSGDYSIALYLYPNSSPSTQIEYCKIAYAQYGIDVQTLINNPIQNNILRNQQVADFWVTQQGSSIGVTIQNNLILSHNASYGIYLDNWFSYATIYNNTIDGPVDGIRVGGDSPVGDCRNNLISNCSGRALSTDGSFDNHSYNRFYNNTVNYENVDVGSNETTLSQNPYVVSANGSYYLNQTNTGVINAGDTTVPPYFRKKTTTAPNWILTDITTSQTWSKVPRDTGKVDIGFHYDPVDYVVGTTNNMVITVSNTATTARLTILPGVVVSYWRSYSLNTSQILINLGDIVAHGHADDRIRFDSIYATGDSITYALGNNSYSYLKAIRLGAGINGMEALIQNCEFYHGSAGIMVEQNQTIPCYRLISDNLFKNCNYGIAVVDAFARIYNNLFIGGNNGLYSVYVADNSHSNDTCYIWNNTMDGNYKTSKGIYAKNASGSDNVVDIRNNIITGYTENGILLEDSYSGSVAYNCLYNNAADYSGGFSAISTLSQNPRFVYKGTSQRNDRYYLAQTTGNVSQRPYRNDSYLEEIDVSGITNFPYQFRVSVCVYPDMNSGYGLGAYTYSGGEGSGDYIDSATNYSTYGPGYIFLDIQNGGVDSWTLQNGDYVKLIFANGKQLKVYLPSKTINGYENPEGPYLSLMLWAAQDGSSYYADQQHQAGYGLNQEAEYALNYDTAGLAASSYTYLGKSPCVNAGDTSIRAYGSTHTALTNNLQRVDIGYHPQNHGFIRVAENQTQFEYEDGSPFIPIGHNCFTPMIAYQDNSTNVQDITDYFCKMTSNGENFLRLIVEYIPPSDANRFKACLESLLATNLYDEPQYDETNMTRWIDRVFDVADQYGIYLHLAFWDSYNMRMNWDNCIYHTSGLCVSTSDFIDITNSIGTYNQKKKFEYIINRWGEREHFAAWDLMNEINNFFENQDNNYDNANPWIEEMGKYVKKREIELYGRSRLRTVSTNQSSGSSVFANTTYFYCNPELDFIAEHFYDNDGAVMNPDTTTDPYAIRPAMRVEQAIRIVKSHSTYSTRPYIASEYCPLSWDRQEPYHSEPLPPAYDEQYQLNMIWTNFTNGAVGTGLRWPIDVSAIYLGDYIVGYNKYPVTLGTTSKNPHNDKSWQYNPFTDNMFTYQSTFHYIVSQLDLAEMNLSDASSRVNIPQVGNKHVWVSATGNDKRILMRFVNTDITVPTIINVPETTMTINGFNVEYSSGMYTLYNDETGGVIGTPSTISIVNGVVSNITLPTFSKHLVAIIKVE